MTPSGTHQDSHNQQMCGEQAARDFSALQAEVEGLKALFLFSHARKLLAQARPENMADPRQRHWVFQQLALCTYKDEELPPEKRFAQALVVLETHLGVPALFEPLPLEGLYPGRTVRLVDGGVHDNQGVAGLLDEACNLIFCSDASGQMEDQANPASGLFSVF